MQSGVEVAESWISTAIGAVQHELVWFGQWRSVTKSRGGAEKFWPPDQLCTFFFSEHYKRTEASSWNGIMKLPAKFSYRAPSSRDYFFGICSHFSHGGEGVPLRG
jgi:hypothetical protein